MAKVDVLVVTVALFSAAVTKFWTWVVMAATCAVTAVRASIIIGKSAGTGLAAIFCCDLVETMVQDVLWKRGGKECFWELAFGSYETARSLQGSSCGTMRVLLGALRLLGVLRFWLVENEGFASESSAAWSDAFLNSDSAEEVCHNLDVLLLVWASSLAVGFI